MSELSSTDTLAEESVPVASQGEPPIVLRIGEKCFYTNVLTLTKESAYFRTMLSQPPIHGTFFVDADPGLFSYVLRYLRRGIYPVCFSRSSGHDYVTYSGIRLLADKFGIERLARWIAGRQYESAIECSLSVEWTRLMGMPASHSSAEQINCFGTPENGWIHMFKRRFTAREDVFLRQNSDSA
ncbi:hypothetical protein DHEL01_v201855 [Diaporthe helianthi]|uniref:BTB domain-containing protein n=1 Tax=Diaporthe helianthi TaxID=158607 RepID=A0A2P5IB87_DIAHE|nr:hypothetical protein DHEL01_v201855 [Diaporthe helianthi]